MGKAKRERGREKRAQRELTLEQTTVKMRQSRRRAIMIGVPVAAVVVAAIVVGILGSQGSGTTTHASASKLQAALATVAGIPQQGRTLGKVSAPVTIHEYADLQCPICREFKEQVLPKLITDEIRTGKAKITYEPFVILGDDSYTAAEAMQAAAAQGRAWQFIEAFYTNQGEERTGYVTTSFVNRMATDAGVDVTKMRAALNGDDLKTYDDTISQTQSDAQANGFTGTPSILVEGPGGKKTISDAFNLGSIESAVSSVSKA